MRLKAGFSPPHWKRGGNKWDDGYQTTGYFLAWIEERYGDGTIQELNESLRDKEYDAKIFKRLTGHGVDKLWALYKESLES